MKPTCIRPVKATPSRSAHRQRPDNPELDAAVGEDLAAQLRDELELVQGASHEFDQEAFLSGELTPVFFGTALGNFGVDHMLDGLVARAPAPMPRKTDTREVTAAEEKFTGFVFKIQPTWIRNTATVWPSCAWCPAATRRA